MYIITLYMAPSESAVHCISASSMGSMMRGVAIRNEE